jgi:hypothetical protein
MILRNKVIYLISYEEWGPMLMSKHHYAIELANLGNQVYFIGHTDKRKKLRRGHISVKRSFLENLFIVEHRLYHPYFLKFKATRLYNILTGVHIKSIIRKIGKGPDVILSFDTGNSLPLSLFPKKTLRIYLPVDGPFDTVFELAAASHSQVIFSVAEKILKFYDSLPVPKHKLDHGVSNEFIAEDISDIINEPLRIGYSGSLLRNDIDVSVFLNIVRENQDKVFEIWGEYDAEASSIHLAQDVPIATHDFIHELKQMNNVILHGAVDSASLAKGLKQVDAFLLCYNIKNLQNSHKILEYLGSGKVIISSFVSRYANRPDLIQMVQDPQSNSGFEILFDEVTSRIKQHNTIEAQNNRITYASDYTYHKQVKRIEEAITEFAGE